MEHGKKKSFLRGIAWQGSVSVIFMLRGFVTLPLIAKALGAEAYGIITQLMVTLVLVAPIMTLHLDAALVRYHASNERDAQISDDLFAALASITMLLFATVLIGGVLFPGTIAEVVFGSRHYERLASLMMVMLVPQTVNLLSVSYYQMRRRFRFASLVQIVGIVLQLTSIAVVVWLGGGVWQVAISILIVDSLQMCFILICIMAEIGRPRFRLSLPWHLLKYSLPLLPSHISLWVINMSSRYILLHYWGMKDVGVYAAIYALGSLSGFIINPMTYVLFPIVSASNEEAQYSSSRINSVLYGLRLLWALGMPSVVGLSMLADVILKALATAEFSRSAGAVLLVSFGALAMGCYRVINVVPLTLGRTREIFFVLLGGMTLNIILALACIPSYGVYGAAFAYLSSYLGIAIWNAVRYMRGVRSELSTHHLYFILKVSIAALGMGVMIALNRHLNYLPLWGIVPLAGFVYMALLILSGGLEDSEREILRGVGRKLNIITVTE